MAWRNYHPTKLFAWPGASNSDAGETEPNEPKSCVAA
jgi:hypothetical protein